MGGTFPPELVIIGKKIVEKYKGLQLAIVVIFGILSNMSKESECWEEVVERMDSVLVSNTEEYQGILAMSYNYLPHHLKACFFYLCAFLEDCKIEY